MSELTPCNYCTLRDIKRQAFEENKKVTILYNSTWHSGKGCNIYVHPDEVKLQDVKEDSALHNKYSVAWFMELPNKCCC